MADRYVLRIGDPYLYADPAGVSASVADAALTYDQGGAEPFYQTDLESYAVGSSLSGTGANGFTWGVPLYADVQDDIAYNGTKSLTFYYGPTEPNDDPHWWSEQTFNLGRNAQELWLHYKIYFLDGTEGLGAAYAHPSGTNNKFLSLWADSYQSEPITLIQLWYSNGDSTINCGITYGNQDGDSDLVRYPSHNPPTTINTAVFVDLDTDLGRWIDVKHHVRISDIGSSNGAYHLWKDDVQILKLENLANWDEAETNNYIRSGYLMGYDNARFQANTRIYIDDIKFYDQNPGW